MSRRYSVAAARAAISDLLDEAERGETVVIERRGVRFDLLARRPPKRASARVSMVAYVDPAILDGGEWSWDWKPGGLRFKAGRRRS